MVFIRCTPPPDFETSALVGTWLAVVDRDTIIEEWKMLDHSLKGQDFYSKNGLRELVENISIETADGKLQYVVSAFGQNDELPVTFVAAHQTKKQITFENRDHDFPQVIAYNIINPDSIIATVGMWPIADDKEPLVFAFSRVK
ncbi:MAG: DUF6265 family protein [Flavobacteriales bacterium]